VLAQDNDPLAPADPTACLEVFRTALLNTALECEETGTSEACYGSRDVTLSIADTDASDGEPFAFPGERVRLYQIETLTSGAMDVEIGNYGITTMAIPLPETALLTMLVFGDVTLDNLGAGLITTTVQVTNANGVLARAEPESEAAQVGAFGRGTLLTATGQAEDGVWLRVQLADGASGWVLAGGVVLAENTAASMDELAIIEADADEIVYAPMRAITLVTGIAASDIRDAPCPAAPDSGLLLQTPEATSATLLVNGFAVGLAGTIFLQASADDTLHVNVLEGEAIVRGEDDPSQTVAAGTVYIAQTGQPPVPYDYERLERLPRELLPRPVMLAVDWQRVLIPAQDNPLAGIAADAVCTIAVGSPVNVRVGPGRDYALRGSLLAGQSVQPDGRAAGIDGRAWWRLMPGAWVSVDVTVAAGDCAAVPFVDVLPRPLSGVDG
jgi:uncharacterized protein YraI